jgi:uncharacterized protein
MLYSLSPITPMHGQFTWYELMTTDVPGAVKFYPMVTGWGIEEWDKAHYTMWTSGGKPLGGVMELSPEQRARGTRSSWLPYVAVNDVDDSAKKAASLGGKVHVPPQDIPGTGRFAVLQDPQGAFFAIYKSNNPEPGFDGTRSPGRFSWHELMTTDYKAALEFYRTLFGWEKLQANDMGDLGVYLEFGMNGKMFGGMFNRTPEMSQVPPFWLSYVAVPDLKRATDVATRNGAKIVNGPMEVPGGDWIVVMADPQGAAFALHQAASRPAATAGTSASKPRTKPKAKTKARAKPKKAVKSKAKARKPKTRPKGGAKRSRTKARSKARPKKKTRRR